MVKRPSKNDRMRDLFGFKPIDKTIAKGVNIEELSQREFNKIDKKRVVYSRYNKSDMQELEAMLMEFARSGEIIEKEVMSAFLEKVSLKASNNFYSISKVNKQRSYSPEWKRLPSGLPLKKFKELGTITGAVIDSFYSDVVKAVGLNDFDLEDFKNRAKKIAHGEIVRVSNATVTAVAQENGFSGWIWGSTSSNNPRADHEVLVGIYSEIGETPAEGGEFPAELPNCNCHMIFVK